MIVTEEEAKTKRCQETIAETWGTQRPKGPTSIHCIGSACMAWRWHVHNIYEPVPDDPQNFKVKEELCTHGYCGKAGKP